MICHSDFDAFKEAYKAGRPVRAADLLWERSRERAKQRAARAACTQCSDDETCGAHMTDLVCSNCRGKGGFQGCDGCGCGTCPDDRYTVCTVCKGSGGAAPGCLQCVAGGPHPWHDDGTPGPGREAWQHGGPFAPPERVD